MRHRFASTLLTTALFGGVGCGEGERMQTGTQVQVSDNLLEEARAQDAYFDSLKKTSKKAAPEKAAAPQPGEADASKAPPK